MVTRQVRPLLTPTQTRHRLWSILEPTTAYPRGAFLSILCSVFVLTADAGTFRTSTSSFTLRIFPALIGECSWYTVCSRRWIPSDSSVPFILSGKAMADRLSVMR